MAEASSRIGRLRRADRAAVIVITLGGIAVVVAVLGILLFVASEAIPLFRGARMVESAPLILPAPTSPARRATSALGVDEYQRFLYTVAPAGSIVLQPLDGSARRDLPIPPVAGASITAASITSGQNVAVGWSNGHVTLLQLRFSPVYEAETLREVVPSIREIGTFAVDPAGRAVLQVSATAADRLAVAAQVTASEIAFAWADSTDAIADAQRTALAVPDEITTLRVGPSGALIAGTSAGTVLHWELLDVPELTDTSTVSAAPVTALEWMIGGNSYVVAAADGTLSGWLRASVGEGRTAMVQAHQFEPQGAPVRHIGVSLRERSFATAADDGSVLLRHQTSERVLARVALGAAVRSLVITPKADALLAWQEQRLRRLTLHNPHPEISLHALFGKVWYEGYDRPEYVWQSTAATDDVEPKFSLVPLIFGTIKGTLYAMLFAVPLAVLAALYTSQFASPSMRAKIKPTVEIMAALPSVVIGFLAGLYLASVVDRNLVAVILMLPLMIACGTCGVILWRLLPRPLAHRLPAGAELALILPVLVAAVFLALAVGPYVERALFGGDARMWLQSAWGLTYDQRNCLVVGIAMGFAIIPIIFTISEDAFSSVPSSLTAASLALGASRWQTAVRVVLPTASPGIFSAVMVGFGRAVGETMIVLMATGNTPVMDWSIFNGIRTMSANIAVEIPEAPHGGTLYRVLFLAAALLFVMTFIVNTIAEIIRQRLRDRYKAA